MGQNISSPPLKNKWSPHHVLTVTLHVMRNSKKSKWQKPQKTIFRHCNIHAQAHSITPQAPSETFPPTSFFIPSLRHQLPVRRGHTCTMETSLLVIQFQEACLSFKTAKCWIQTSPLNRLCLFHINYTLYQIAIF